MKNRSRIALLIVALFMLCGVSITAYQSISKVITLIDDGKVTQYETDASSVEELLEQLEVVLGDKDTLQPASETEIVDNMKITINRWKPTVNFVHNGAAIEIKTSVATVEEIIKAKGLSHTEGLVVEPKLETEITDGMTITVKTTKVEKVLEEQQIGFTKKVVETTDLAFGETKVKQQGVNGLKEVSIEKTYLGGELVSEEVIGVKITKQPVEEITLKGVRSSVKDTFTGKSYAYTKSYEMEATAYTTGNDGWGNQTASGMTTFVGMVAVDPRVIPLGTKIYVEGYGIAIAGDTGGAIKGHIVDLFFNTNSECYTFGRRHGLDVYILEDQSIDVKAERRFY